MGEHLRILKVIDRIRDSFEGAAEVYTNGSCVKLAMILLEIFPQGKILYDGNHAIFEHGDCCYDINGIAEKTEDHFSLREYGILEIYDLMVIKYNIIHQNKNHGKSETGNHQARPEGRRRAPEPIYEPESEGFDDTEPIGEELARHSGHESDSAGKRQRKRPLLHR
jgi:hypothetical protein